MDIFEEIKEAVLSATPGEDTRNYYRNQGMKIEQDRIVKMLEHDYWHHLSFLPRLATEKPRLEHHVECLGCQLIAIIKGEK